MSFDPTGALAGRYKAGTFRFLVYAASRSLLLYRVVIYRVQKNGSLRVRYNGLVGNATSPKDAARTALRILTDTGKVTDDAHIRVKLEEW